MTADAILEMLDPVAVRWTVGGRAAGTAPGDWRPALEGVDDDEAELRLLALAAQFLDVAVRASAPETLRALPDLPPLGLPTLPQRQRGTARRLMEQYRDARLLFFLAARGVVMHPEDWLPSRGDEDLPDAYAPWRDWWDSAASERTRLAPPADELSEESWDDYFPAARRIAFAALRQRNPGRAVDLLAAKASGESAEMRLKLIDLLAAGLSDRDRPYLESLLADRSPRIKAMASAYLSRLGHGGGGAAADVTELAEFFEVRTSGFLRRTRTAAALQVKTPAQRSRRATLFGEIDLAAFAAALQMTPQELVASWPLGDDQEADGLLMAMVARSAPDAGVAFCLDRLSAQRTISVPLFISLAGRMTTRQKHAVMRRVLEADGGSFVTALDLGAGLGLDGALDTRAGRSLLKALADAQSNTTANMTFNPELYALGMLVSRDGARVAVDRLAAAGIVSADPRLDMLRLNAALEENGATE